MDTTGILTLEELTKTYNDLMRSRPDRMEILYNPLTAMGRYAERFSKIEDANRNRSPLGSGKWLIPMREFNYLPEGIVLVRNLEYENDGLSEQAFTTWMEKERLKSKRQHQTPEIQIIDLRTDEEKKL